MEEREGGEKVGKYLMAVIAWIVIGWLILKLTGWGPRDIGFWGLIIMGLPVGIFTAEMFLGKKKE